MTETIGKVYAVITGAPNKFMVVRVIRETPASFDIAYPSGFTSRVRKTQVITLVPEDKLAYANECIRLYELSFKAIAEKERELFAQKVEAYNTTQYALIMECQKPKGE